MTPPRRIAAPAHCSPSWAALVAAVSLVAAGCGLRTEPHPISQVLPGPVQLSLHGQESRAVLTWQEPPDTNRFGGVLGYRVLIERRKIDCPTCAADEQQDVTLSGQRLDAARAGAGFTYAFAVGDTPAIWQAAVAARYAVGESLPVSALVLEAPVRLPVHELTAVWLEGARPVLALTWLPRRDRIVQVLGTERQPVLRELPFRMNIYRREPGGDWPLLPINPSPIKEGQWLINFIVPNPPPVEYGLRLVDQRGNEGPMSAAVPLPPLPRAARKS